MTEPKQFTDINVYVAFDPGKTTGVAVWDESGKAILVGCELNEDDLDNYLDNLVPETVKLFIIEEYRIYSSVPHIGSKVETVQVIGQLKAYARKHNIKTIEVPADRKEIAAKWAQVSLPKGKTHLPDWKAAYLIGYYYLHREGVIEPSVLKDETIPNKKNILGQW